MDEGRAVDAIFLSFNKASDHVSCNTFETEAGYYSLHGWTTRWMKHCLYDWTQRVNANIKGITAEVCTGICPDCDYVTWRRRGIALMPSLQLMPNWWDWWVCLRAGLLSGGIWTGRRNRTIEIF